MARKPARGVFCLENPWSARLTDRSSVRPLLEVLEARGCAQFIHRDVATVGELEFYARKWAQQQYSSYRLGYFAFHGDARGIFIGRKHYSLAQIGDILGSSCAGKVIYFAGCGTVDCSRAELRTFQDQTRCKAVCGYTKAVDWLESSAFEMLLIDAVTRFSRIDATDRWLRTEHAGLVKRLGFKLVW